MKRLFVPCVAAIFSLLVVGQSHPQEGEKKPLLKRLNDASEEDLRKQLLRAPDVGLDQNAVGVLYGMMQRGATFNVRPEIGPQFLAKARGVQAASLPWRSAVDCQLGKETAQQLQVLSTTLRDYLRQSVPSGDIRPDPEKLRTLLFNGTLPANKGLLGLPFAVVPKVKTEEWTKPEAIPAIQQLLQAENAPVRLVMVDLLANIPAKPASIALAQRALFDVSADVREKAIMALAGRPHMHYRQVLLDGLRYPWAPAAEHAAEAIVALKVTDVVPGIVPLLKEPDPRLPFVVETQKQPVYFIRELVRMNHLSNCMVCHAPSQSKEDLVRGRVPIPNEDPPPLYYAERTGTFVRADITYLKQDFSFPQPVANNGKWPGNQRYDYFLRTRQLSAPEVKHFKQLTQENKLPDPLEFREPLLFALREVSNQNLGKTYSDWVPLLKAIEKKK